MHAALQDLLASCKSYANCLHCRTFLAGFCALNGSSCESATSDSSLVPPLLDSLAALNTLPSPDSLALLLLPESDALALLAAGWLVRGSKLGWVLDRAAFCKLQVAACEHLCQMFLCAVVEHHAGTLWNTQLVCLFI